VCAGVWLHAAVRPAVDEKELQRWVLPYVVPCLPSPSPCLRVHLRLRVVRCG
jgi:hypothetical protein